jgi:hypothetical protein
MVLWGALEHSEIAEHDPKMLSWCIRLRSFPLVLTRTAGIPLSFLALSAKAAAIN